MSKRLVQAEKRELYTREEVVQLAQILQSFGGTDTEREIKNNRMARAKEKILSLDDMRPFTWAIARTLERELPERVNGQHTSEVFLKLTDDEWAQVKFPVIVYWEEWECETPRDVAIAFEQYDTAWSSRSVDDITGVHMNQVPYLRQLLAEGETRKSGRPTGMTKKLGKQLGAGLAWYGEKVEGHPKSASYRYQVFHLNSNIETFFVWASDMLSAKRMPDMLNAPVVGAMYHTLLAGHGPNEREAANLFWKDITLGWTVTPEGSIAWKLAQFLELLSDCNYEWPREVVKQLKGRQQRPADLDIFATCLRAVRNAVRGTEIAGSIFVGAKGRSAAELMAAYYPLPKPVA